MSSGPRILGIDLGTTNSAVSVFEDGAARILPNRLGARLTPSCVALDPKGDGLLIGRPAREVLALHPDRAVAAFKRGMGTEQTYTLGTETYGAIELSALILRALREDAEAALGEDLRKAVITVPAYFNDEQRYATMKAGELAELEVERIVNEPTAAAMAFGLHEAEDESTFLVFDLGGGTFDVCVMERFEGILQVRSTAGESRLGGEDFTRRLAARAMSEIGLNFEKVEATDPVGLAIFLKRCELAKRTLSEQDEVRLTLPALEGLLSKPVDISIGPEDTRAAWEPLLDRLRAPCKSALRGAKIDADELEKVILVGGATRMRCVREFVRSFFEQDPTAGVDPDLAVVRGAAVQAALCARDEAVEDLVVTDVASHSLGVEVVREIAGRHVPGYFSPLIHRNTVIPTSRTESFQTVAPNQTTLTLEVYEGESRRVKNNRFIGRLEVTDIPRSQDEQQVDVTLTYDLNGLLEVEAKVVATGRSIARIFTRSAANLTEGELARAAERIRKLKEDPRQKPRYRDLLLRAEALWQDLEPGPRELLSFHIDRFETSLDHRTPSEIDEAYDSLSEFCDELDGGERW